jgi:hypothetical protein
MFGYGLWWSWLTLSFANRDPEVAYDAGCHVTLGRAPRPAAFATLSPPTEAASTYQRTFDVS